MKNLYILTAAALSLTFANVASASWTGTDTTGWSGDSGTLSAEGCSFRRQTTGVILRNGANWETTSSGYVQVRSRNVSSISLSSDNVLRNEDGSDTGVTATVDYLADGMNAIVQTRAIDGTSNVASDAMTITGITGTNAALSVFTIGGGAVMSLAGSNDAQDALDALTNDTTYKINHTITCVN